MSIAHVHAEAILNNVVDKYDTLFKENNSFESLLFFFMSITPSNPESHTIVSLRSALDQFRQKYLHKYLHYQQDKRGEPFVKAFHTFAEIKEPKKKQYVEFIQTLRQMWTEPLPGGMVHGQYLVFARPDDLVSKWCFDQVQALTDLKTCAFCQGKKQLIRSHIVQLPEGGTHCPANILVTCRTCRESGKTITKKQIEERKRLMLCIDNKIDGTVQKLVQLPVTFVQGYYLNPNYDTQASMNVAVQNTLGAIDPVLQKCQQELHAARRVCAELDLEHRECQKKMHTLQSERRSIQEYNQSLRNIIRDRDDELRHVYRKLDRLTRSHQYNYRDQYHQNQRGYGAVYGQRPLNAWNIG